MPAATPRPGPPAPPLPTGADLAPPPGPCRTPAPRCARRRPRKPPGRPWPPGPAAPAARRPRHARRLEAIADRHPVSHFLFVTVARDSWLVPAVAPGSDADGPHQCAPVARSEEHTSELQ